MRQPGIRGSLLVAVVLAALLLAAPAAGAEGSTSARRAKVEALVVKRAASPLLRALRARLGGRLELDRTSAPPPRRAAPKRLRRYDLLIVDGDNLSPRRLAHNKLLARAAARGIWVLALDVRPGHFRRALRRHTGFNARGRRRKGSRMFLFRRTMAGGSPRVQMIEAQSLAPRHSARLPKRRRRQLTKSGARRIAGTVQAALRNRLPGQGGQASEAGIPPELQHVGWSYTRVGHQKMPRGWWSVKRGKEKLIGVPKPGSQTAVWSITHNFDVYLDNSPGHPQGNYQIVSYEIDGEFTPKSAGSQFVQMNNPFQVGFNKLFLERAWWTGAFGIEVRPEGGADRVLSWQASQPETPDSTTTYSSGNSFKVGFSASSKGGGIGGSYKVSNEKSYSVPDWGVQNLGSGNELKWEFSSRSCDIRTGHYHEAGCFKNCCNRTTLRPNELSLGQFQAHASGWWKTEKPLPASSRLEFFVGTPIVVADTYCEEYAVVACLGRKVSGSIAYVEPRRYQIDAGAVDPVPIASFGLAPNPANGGRKQKVTGTVKLARPAAIDTNVVVYSNSGNAIVGRPIDGGPGNQTTITIHKGQSTGTFSILTNDNNLGRHGHTTAAISVFYTKAKTRQLRINARKKTAP
jgi:hypothetical protein